MEVVERKRCGQITKAQKAAIIDYISEHPELKSGKFSQNFTFKTAQELWKNLAELLNAMPGSRKDWEKWRKTWHDMKNLTKSKGTHMKKHRNETGGGPPKEELLNSDDEKILTLISTVAVEGHINVSESEAVFFPQDNIIVEEYEEVGHVESDHNYVPNIDNKIFAQHELKKESVIKSKTHEESQEIRGTKINTPRASHIDRLNHTISATEQMANQMNRKIRMKRNYCNKKLQIMRNEFAAKERITTALEIIAKALQER